jgi:hypothetical protein
MPIPKKVSKSTQEKIDAKIAADRQHEQDLLDDMKNTIQESDEPETTEPETSTEPRQMVEITEFRGRVQIMVEGEILAGLNTLKEGRLIGKDEHPTFEVFNLATKELVIIPFNKVLQSKINALFESTGKEIYFLEITYLGKVKGSSQTYHNFRLQSGEPSQAELTLLSNYELSQK